MAICTVEPPTKTGSSTANGVALPVRPIDTWMSRQAGGALLGRELVGDGPPGGLGRGPQRSLPGQAVHLHHRPVDLVGQIVAMLQPVLGETGHLPDGGQPGAAPD